MRQPKPFHATGLFLYPLKTFFKETSGMKWVNKMHVFKVKNEDIKSRKEARKVINSVKQVQDSFPLSNW